MVPSTAGNGIMNSFPAAALEMVCLLSFAVVLVVVITVVMRCCQKRKPSSEWVDTDAESGRSYGGEFEEASPEVLHVSFPGPLNPTGSTSCPELRVNPSSISVTVKVEAEVNKRMKMQPVTEEEEEKGDDNAKKNLRIEEDKDNEEYTEKEIRKEDEEKKDEVLRTKEDKGSEEYTKRREFRKECEVKKDEVLGIEEDRDGEKYTKEKNEDDEKHNELNYKEMGFLNSVYGPFKLPDEPAQRTVKKEEERKLGDPPQTEEHNPENLQIEDLEDLDTDDDEPVLYEYVQYSTLECFDIEDDDVLPGEEPDNEEEDMEDLDGEDGAEGADRVPNYDYGYHVKVFPERRYLSTDRVNWYRYEDGEEEESERDEGAAAWPLASTSREGQEEDVEGREDEEEVYHEANETLSSIPPRADSEGSLYYSFRSEDPKDNK